MKSTTIMQEFVHNLLNVINEMDFINVGHIWAILLTQMKK